MTSTTVRPGILGKPEKWFKEQRQELWIHRCLEELECAPMKVYKPFTGTATHEFYDTEL